MSVSGNLDGMASDGRGKPSTSAGAETSGLRRSVRETPSKKNNMIPISSPSSTRKSERLEKQTPTPPTPPVKRKSERAEKQTSTLTPGPLRRSERGKKHSSSSSSSGSKKSNKSLGFSLSVMKKKLKKEKSVKQLTFETKEVNKSQKQMGEKRIMDARAYRTLFKQQPKKVKVAGHCKEQNKEDKFSQECSSNIEGGASKNVDRGNHCSQSKVQEKREVYAGKDSERTLEESNCIVNKPAHEILENNIGFESSHSSQNHKFMGEAHQSKGRDSAPNDVAEKAKKNLQRQLVNPILNKGAQDKNARLESGYKETSSNRKRNTVDMDPDATAMATRKDICTSAGDATISSPHGNKSAETYASDFKRQRVNNDSKWQGLCSGDANLNQDFHGTSLAEDRREIGLSVTTGLAEQCISNLQCKGSPVDFQLVRDQNICLICKRGGKLLCCDGRGCKTSYHLSCLDPPLKDVPLGVWYCRACVRKKIQSGVHSVSEGVESIWDAKEVELADENGLKEKQFFVKYKGLAHIHNRWVPESQLLLEAPSLVAKFNRKNQSTKWKQEWTEPYRLLDKWLAVSPKELDAIRWGRTDFVSKQHYEWLVKWRGLDYEHATWELETASFKSLPKIQSLIKDYENRHEKAKRRHYLFVIDKKHDIKKASSVKSLKLSAGGLTGSDNNHLDFINNLCECWSKGQNVVIDDRERIMKVISFISSLSSNVYWPFLIITTSAALCLWDEEFFRLAPSVNAVVYQGNKDVRGSIRAVEFHGREGGIMFDVLITSPEVIAEDLNVLKLIKWEAVIVDECQRSRINSHFEQVKSLITNMRLLLLNGQLKDGIIEHLLSFLDCQIDTNGSEGLITNSNHKIGNLKERLSKYIVNGSKSDSSRYIEYWVPVQVSNIQLEKYCATLLSNTLSLFSSSRNDPVGALRDILISTRMFCDHPFIMDYPYTLDKELQKSFRVCTAAEILDLGIKASGKLQLLDAMLFEIRKKGLRVLILFQSSGGRKDNIGDILDDFVRQRFGQDSYERIDGFVVPARKQDALNNFNNQKQRFVFLLETCACVPSIKLSSVDTVIIFSSDWNPTIDVRNLQKITLDTQYEQLKVFRLYSTFTVEENVLILAKKGKTLDSKLQSISQRTSHNLLMWGVKYLFSKLDEFHKGCTLVTSGSTSFEQSTLKDIIHEFLTILPQNAKDNTSNSSIVLKVKQSQGSYSTDFSLPGELIESRDEDLPHVFWKKLLQERFPTWKYPSSLSPRNRKRNQPIDDSLKKQEGKGNEIVKRRKKVANNDDPPSLKPALSSENIVAGENEGCLNSSFVDHASTTTSFGNTLSEVPAVGLAKFNERINLHDLQKSLHLDLQPKIAKLCEILHLPENVKAIVQSFLGYVMNNHHVSREPATILQAFQISLCWTAASLLKHKLDHKESLALAKQHLNFDCKKEEADFVYSMLRCLKKMFLYHTGNFTVAFSPKSSQSLTKVLNKDPLHARSSQLTAKVGFENLACGQEFIDDQVLSQLGLAQQDFSKSIKDIEKKLHKQMAKLSQRKREEKEELEKKYKEEKEKLELMQKTEAAVIRLHSNSSMRTDKLKLLDIEYGKKFEELQHQREIDVKNLEASHLAAMDKLLERKAFWINGVKSWAKEELVNKSPSNATGHNQDDGSLGSLLKEQNPDGIKSMQDREFLENPENVSSNDEEDLVPGASSTNEQITNGVKSGMLVGEDPLRVSKAISLRNGLENVEFIHVPSSKERILENMGALEAVDDSNTIFQEKDGVHAVPSDNATEVDHQDEVVFIVNQDPHSNMTAGGDQQNGKVSSAVPESASSNAVGSKTVRQQDGKVLAHKTISNENSDSSDKMARVSQQDGEFLLSVPETAPVDVVDGGETGKKQDGGVQTDETTDNQDPRSLDRTAGVVEGESTGRDNNGLCDMASSFDSRADQQDGVMASRVLGNVPNEVVECGSSGREINDVCLEPPCNNARVVQQDVVVTVITEDDHPQELALENSPANQPEPPLSQDIPVQLIQAVQGDSPLPIASTRLRDGVASANGDHNSLQQVETSISHPNDAVASSRTNSDGLVAEHVLQTQLSPSTDAAFSLDAMDLPSASAIEHQLSHEGPITNNIVEPSMQIVEDQTEHSNQAALQPVTHLGQHLPTENPLDGSGMHVSDTRTLPISSGVSRPSQTAPPVRVPPLPPYHDPLQNELERIRKEKDQIINIHEDTKLRLKSDCEKEIEEIVSQIRRKYEIKLQDMESEFVLKKKELDTNHQKVLMNKILAEAFRSKCMDTKSSSGPGMQQEVTSSFMQQLLQISSQPTAQRNAIVSGLPSAGSPAGGPQIAAPSSHGSAPSLQVVHHSSALFSGTLTRPPHISSISPATGNPQVGSEIRAPAPHLQAFRPSASTIATNISSLSVGMPSQQVPSNLPTTSAASQLPLRAHQSHPHNIAHRPETAGILSSLSNSSLSALELLLDVENQNTNLNSRSLTHLGSNSDPLVTPELRPLNNTRTDTTCPSEIVCLSDSDDD